MKFTDGLDTDLKTALLGQLRTLWTHTSTAIEGNTLDLGETDFVIREGLTIKGKPVKDHEEVIGHARAIDLLITLNTQNTIITTTQLFDLHKAVMTQVLWDIYQPIGTWKVESNYTYAINDNHQSFMIEFATPDAVPLLMQSWFKRLNQFCHQTTDNSDKLAQRFTELHISFVRIHPFFDGNGRLARLTANLPIIKSGQPPIVIPATQRQEYIKHLSAYHAKHGQITPDTPLAPTGREFDALVDFFKSIWSETIDLVSRAHSLQANR